MSVESEQDLAALKAIGKIVADTLRLLREQVAPGVTTARLDQIARRYLERNGARPAPELTYNYPGATCISVNDEAAHGVPGKRRLQPGDVVKLDVSAEKGGYFADAAITVGVPPVAKATAELIAAARRARDAGISAAVAGQPLSAIGDAAETVAREGGFVIIEELPGHGLGRGLHETPSVPSHRDPTASQPLTDGLVITVEPHLTTGSGALAEAPDGWTLRTRNRARVAAFEHTIVVTRSRPIVVTG
ncbi:MAG: type I methionyl aminopeptidase [Gemmatimonadetes bacterium]|nr:type I methionyl aminopeptidase [Gemmatimonadota bacterium]